MAKSTKEINYDKEEDILFFSMKRKVKASIDIGDFIIDIDNKGFVSGIEILNASENLNISQRKLENMQNALMNVTYKPKYVYISLVIKFKDKEKDITIPLTVDLGHGSVRTEKTKFAVASV